MGDLQGRKVFKVFNQEFIVDERYTVTKELGQGAYGIVWYVSRRRDKMRQSGKYKSWPRLEWYIILEQPSDLTP